MSGIKKVIDFWFEGIDDSTYLDRATNPCKKWFIQDKGFDDEIRRKFETDIQMAARGKYHGWEKSGDGLLALIILLDQFTRNVYRDTEKMYASDPMALALALRVINEGRGREFLLIHRAFLYLPLMHSEDLGIQKQSVEHYTRLVEESKKINPSNTGYYEYTLKYAREHHDTVAESGRFPHRDRILKRVVSSTPPGKKSIS